MAVKYVYRDGARMTPYMLYQIERLDADLYRLFGVHVFVTYAIRTHQQQIDIFLARYVTAANVRGRKVYDTRVWNGVRYYRISSAGTVAVPGYSNHEIQGTNCAFDLRDTGRDAGIATWGSKRSNWLRANCGKYDMEPEGFMFGEAWHYKIRNIFKAVPSSPAGGGAVSEETKVMKLYHREDATSRSKGREMGPGSSFYLHTTDGISTSQASNIVGGVGPYVITLHVYATGAPGDAVEVQLLWDDTKTDGRHSGHYTERMVFDDDGVINRSVTFQRAVASGYAVYANFRTPKTNKSNVRVSVFDADAYLFSV